MSPPDLKIRPAAFPSDTQIVGQLFLAYAQSLSISLDFQNFDAELAGLPGKFGEDVGGAVFLAESLSSQFSDDNGEIEAPAILEVIGCIAIRPFFASGIAVGTSEQKKLCELKRLYLAPASRGRGVAKLLLDAAIQRARGLGYEEMLLDTLSSMATARKLYKSYGFEGIEAYYDSAEGAEFYRLKL